MILQILTQVQPGDLVQLSDSFGLWGTLGIFVIYLIYQTLRDILKNRRDKISSSASIAFQTEILTQLKSQAEINTQILAYLTTVKNEYADEISQQQAMAIIDSIVSVIRFEVLTYANTILKENHIQGNEPDIKAKLKSYIINQFSKACNTLKEFKYDTISLNKYIDTKWKEEIIENVSRIVLEQKDYRTLNSYVQNTFDRYKTEMIAKI